MKEKIQNTVIKALEELKAQNVVIIDVSKITGVTDTMIIATGTSGRHVKSLANNVSNEAKKQGFRPIGEEGSDEGEWVLVDFAHVVVHVMQAEIRTLYNLESLWSGVKEIHDPEI